MKQTGYTLRQIVAVGAAGALAGGGAAGYVVGAGAARGAVLGAFGAAACLAAAVWYIGDRKLASQQNPTLEGAKPWAPTQRRS